MMSSLAYRFVVHSGYCPHCGQSLRRVDDALRNALAEDAGEFDPRYEEVLDLELAPETSDVEEPDDDRYLRFFEEMNM